VYAAPALVVHYIEAHAYDPPSGFAHAVEASARRASGFSQRDADERFAAAERLTRLEPVGETTVRIRPQASARIVVRGHPGCAIRPTPFGAVSIESCPAAIGADGCATITVRAAAAGLHGLKLSTRRSEIVYFIIADP
jgi:hypothetical protein